MERVLTWGWTRPGEEEVGDRLTRLKLGQWSHIYKSIR